MESFTKQPIERLDYDVDFTSWLKAGDAILTTTVTSSPAGLTIETTDAATAIPKLWVSGGVNKKTYVVSTLVITNQGRAKEVNFKLKIKDV